MTDVQKTELQSLQERCQLMGIKYHPNSKEDSLRAKIQASLDDKNPDEVGEDTVDPVDNGKPANSSMPDLSKLDPSILVPKGVFKPETKEEKAYRLRMAGTKLVRVYIHCNNPMKKEWQGEQFTVSNRNLGTLSRFVPFEQEWHVEAAILDMMRDRQYLGFNTRKAGPMKLEIKEPKFIKEFNIEVLDPLTEKEIKDLAIKQAMQSGDSTAGRDE
jgi:hypothetical protein